MQELREKIASFDNTALFVRFSIPDSGADGARGILLFNPGYSDHSGRYGHAVKVLCDNNFIVVSLDLRGNGQSGPALGYCTSFQDIMLDNLFLINLAQQRFGQQVVGLIGHSFGGLVMTYTSALLGANSPPLFLSSPSYTFRKRIHRWQLLLLKLLSKRFPRFLIPAGVVAKDRSNNPDNNATQHTDPLIFKRVALCFAYFFIHLVTRADQTRKAIRNVRARVTVYAGQDDNLCSTAVTRELCRGFGENLHLLQIVERGGHEIFNEKNGAELVALNGLRRWSDSLAPLGPPLIEPV